MNDIIKYNNILNQIQFKDFRAIDSDIFMSIVMKMENQGNKQVQLTFSEIRELINDKSKSKKEFLQNLKIFIDKLQSLKINIELVDNYSVPIDEDDEDFPDYIAFVLFDTILVKPKKELLIIKVNEIFQFVFNELKKNFTQVEFLKFIELKSNYSKNLYRLLRQYNNTGIFISNISDLRKSLDIPIAYENKYIDDKIIKIATKELRNIIPDLSYEKIYGKGKGKPLIGFKFTYNMNNQSKTVKRNTKNKFNQIQKQDYNFNELEKLLLGE